MKKYVCPVLVIVVLALFLASGSTLAQNKAAKSGTDKVVLKLQQKVLLSDDQAAKVKSILNSYNDGDKSSENLVEAKRKVEALFDDKQKAKYEIIKDDWWKDVSTSVK